jgi:hypothetical protein
MTTHKDKAPFRRQSHLLANDLFTKIMETEQKLYSEQADIAFMFAADTSGAFLMSEDGPLACCLD